MLIKVFKVFDKESKDHQKERIKQAKQTINQEKESLDCRVYHIKYDEQCIRQDG